MNEFFNYTDEVEFRSKGSAEDCVRKLELNTVGIFSVGAQLKKSFEFTSYLVGKISKNGVVISRVRPFFQNSFKPYFYGKFSTDGRETVLRGKFTMSRPTKVFMIIWFGILTLITVMSLLAIGWHDSSKLPFLLTLIGFVAFGLGILWVGKRLSSGDVDWISDSIKSAISPDS